MSSAINVQPRRQPRQIRSDRRVTKILDAAIHVFAELGFERATTTVIAARADVSVGSLYQYFPNKAALVHALSDRFDTTFFAVLEEALSRSGAAPIDGLIDALLQALIQMDAAHPGLFQVLAGAYSSAEFVARERCFNAAVAQHIAAALQPHFPAFSEEECLTVAQVCVESIHAIVHLAAWSPASQKDSLLQAGKQMLQSYLGSLTARSAPT